MQFSTIIVAVDIHDPDNGRTALAHANAIAGPEGRLRMLYVRYYLPTRYSDLLVDDFDGQEQEEALAVMRQWRADIGIDADRVEIVTRRGRVRDEVVAEAERNDADLIVIGSHQPSLSSRLLGSNASALVHQSPVSILVVRAQAG